MDNVLKSGIIGGIAGFLLMIVAIVIFSSAWFQFGNTPLAALSMMATFTLAFLVAGVMAGVLAFPSIKTALGSFLPGLIAGFIAVSIPLLFLVLLILIFVYQVLSGESLGWVFIGHTLPLVLLVLVGIGMASLCSALSASVVFFWREFGRKHPVPEREADLESLDALYAELWQDARTLVADMSHSIAVYRIAGMLIVVSGIILLAFALAGWLRELAGGYSSFEFLLTIAATICGLAELAIGPYLLYWYDKLRKRYVNLERVETASGD